MAKTEDVKGIIKTFWGLFKEDFHYLDHKLFKIIAAAIGFLVMAFFWFYFFQGMSLF